MLNRPTAVARGGDIKRTLLARIALAGLVCLLAVAVLSAIETRREETARAAETAEVIGKHLELQLWRIAAGADVASRFPDWDALLPNLPMTGQCVQLSGVDGKIVRNQCTGAPAPDTAAPAWFAQLWMALSGEMAPAQRIVAFNGRVGGTLSVSTDQRMVIHKTWQQLQQFLGLTALIVLAICSLTFTTLSRALAPASTLIDGLERIKAGAFSTRLPAFRLRELDRIGKAANALAEKIEATLAERAELSARLINAQEDERRTLARELHDEFGQNLTAIAALAASIEQAAASDPGIAVEARTVGKIAGDMQSALRSTLRRLKPSEVEAFGLVEGLRQLVDLWNASQTTGTRYRLEMPHEIAPLPPATAMHMFRIAQEGLTNAARHAQARNVRLSLEEIAQPGRRGEPTAGVRITIEDDGKGARTREHTRTDGMGLINMRERVAALAGTIALEDVPGGGLRVRIIIPASAGTDTKTSTSQELRT